MKFISKKFSPPIRGYSSFLKHKHKIRKKPLKILKKFFYKQVLGLQCQSKTTQKRVILENHWTLMYMNGPDPIYFNQTYIHHMRLTLLAFYPPTKKVPPALIHFFEKELHGQSWSKKGHADPDPQVVEHVHLTLKVR